MKAESLIPAMQTLSDAELRRLIAFATGELADRTSAWRVATVLTRLRQALTSLRGHQMGML